MLPLTRRALLGAGAAGALTACTAGPDPGPPAPPDPDVALRAAAVAREQALLAAYDVALADPAQDSPALRAVREEHALHLQALAGAARTSTPATPTTPTAPPAAASPADLRALERDAAAAHAAAVPAASRELAGLLAQLAASESAHLVVL